VVVILDFLRRDHSIVICLQNVVVFVVKQVLHCAGVFTRRGRCRWVIDRISKLTSFVCNWKDLLVGGMNEANNLPHVSLEPKLDDPLRVVTINRKWLLCEVQRLSIHVIIVADILRLYYLLLNILLHLFTLTLVVDFVEHTFLPIS
jgi:hypothetical protein